MAVPKVSGLNCPNCGAAIELRSFTSASSVVCQSCLSVLDARDPNLKILQEANSRERIVPDIPLGTRGTFPSGTFEAIGFQERTTYEDGVAYSWFEYLLFNPYKGFRYLTVFRGHWNFVRTLYTLPQVSGANGVQVGGTAFRIYSNSMAETTFVLGEFPWMVQVGEKVQVTDYVAPPKVLSGETTPEEIVWSMGDYITGEEVWKAFKLTTPPPRAYGSFENQPSPFTGKVGSIWKAALAMAVAALLIASLLFAIGSRKVVYRQSFSLDSAATASFDVPGHGNLQLKTINRTGQPIYVQYSLLRQGAAKPLTFGRQVRFDSNGDVASIPSIPAGRYSLTAEADGPSGLEQRQFEVQLRRDVPAMGWVFAAIVLLFIPPILQSIRAASFERERWAGSDS